MNAESSQRGGSSDGSGAGGTDAREEIESQNSNGDPESDEQPEDSEHGAPSEGRVVRDIFNTDEIFRRVHVTAEHEFEASARLLFLSGVAAGLTISFSFLGPATIAGHVDPTGATLLKSLLYPLGFIFITIGRYQLFTENTLTPVTLVLTRVASIPRLFRIWGIVLVANIVGTALAAFFFAKAPVLDGPVQEAAVHLGESQLSMTWNEVFFTGIVAGWLIAGMVWLNHAARSVTARLLISFLLMYTLGAAGLAHCIAGSADVLYLVMRGDAGLSEYALGFELPAVLGNTLGGVLLVAIVNYGQTRDKLMPNQHPLSWREWFLGADNGWQRRERSRVGRRSSDDET